MSFLFKDEAYAFEALRAAGSAPYGGADLGEVVATARAIGKGDDDAWLREWRATAQRVRALADACLAAGHRVSAREAYLRASNYYRTADFFRRKKPAGDADVLALSRSSRDTFVRAAELMQRPVRQITIPYEDAMLPGYLFLVDDSGIPRPTVIYTNGYDSTAEEAWFAIAAAAIERGYNVLAYDGPGQGAVIRELGLLFRPDWEAVIMPVLDYATGLREVDKDAIAHFGYSLGAYLVARAAAFDKRAGALILDDGIYDFHQAYRNAVPAFLMKLVHARRDRIPNMLMGLFTRIDTQARWGLNNGLWTIGGDSYADFVRRTTGYSLSGIADRITAPTLIMDAEDDQFLHGQPSALAAAMTAPHTIAHFTTAEGAGEHCHVGSLTRAHQVIFDWLDDTLERSTRDRAPATPRRLAETKAVLARTAHQESCSSPEAGRAWLAVSAAPR
jgi:alpha-beta hydrolase superfamily lysophospholipase